MADTARGLRKLAAVVEVLEERGIRVSEVDPVTWEDTMADEHMSVSLTIGVPVEGDDADGRDRDITPADDEKGDSDAAANGGPDAKGADVAAGKDGDQVPTLDAIDEDTLPAAVADLPTSRQRAYALLKQAGELDTRAVQAGIDMAHGTAITALNDLDDRGLATSRADPDDGRRTLWALTDGEDDEPTAEDRSNGQYWCGRCGEGPMTEQGVKTHTGQVHDGDPIIRDTAPDEAALVGDGAADTLHEAAVADVEEVAEEIADEADDQEPTTADGGVVAENGGDPDDGFR